MAGPAGECCTRAKQRREQYRVSCDFTGGDGSDEANHRSKSPHDADDEEEKGEEGRRGNGEADHKVDDTGEDEGLHEGGGDGGVEERERVRGCSMGPLSTGMAHQSIRSLQKLFRTQVITHCVSDGSVALILNLSLPIIAPNKQMS